MPLPTIISFQSILQPPPVISEPFCIHLLQHLYLPSGLDLDLDLTFDTTSVNSSFDQPSLDSTTSIDAFLLQSTFATLTGRDTFRTPTELRYTNEQRFADLVAQHTIAGDPLLSTDIDLRQLLFSSVCPLTDEEESLPDLLRHHLNDNVQALAMKSWHRVLHKDLDHKSSVPSLVSDLLKSFTKLFLISHN